MEKKPVIGLIQGGGTGPELIEVFVKTVSTIYEKEKGGEIEFLSTREIFGYNFHTFNELKANYYKKPYSYVKRIINKEINDILKFDELLLKKKALGIFRTAINAETLYYLRKITRVLKCVPLVIGKKNRKIKLLFIRDHIQGFYTTEKIKTSPRKIEIISKYSESDFLTIINFVKNKIKELNFENAFILFLYKFHIMGIELQKMIDNVIKKIGLKNNYSIMQPDSGIHFLLNDIYKKNNINKIVVICANEIGDTLLETLIHYYDLGTKETFFTSNFVLGKYEFEALQTMHGSADDIAGKGIVNPIATLKAAAYALEKWLKVKGAINRMEKLINQAISMDIKTPDMGGKSKTQEIVDYILKNF